MARIHVLPEQVANRIAAGEVVERPASVVKELVENALDADASRIVVEIGEGGRSFSITDDGCGMGREDGLTALARFATSKIQRAEDLDAVASYGFRGEALPSIASVCRMVIETRERGAEAGTRVQVEGGAVQDVRDTGCPTGTRIEIQDLFFNTPARAKFLRTDATEVRQAINAVVRLALIATGVGFEVTERGRLAFTVAREATLLERLGALLGSKVARNLFPFHGEGAGVHASGYVGAPSLARSTSRDLYIYVNDRFVTDRAVTAAVREAYRSLLPKGRFPVAFLHLRVAAGQVDVNVHPAKHEVRFADRDAVWRAVYRGVAEALEHAPWAAGVRPSALGSGARHPLPHPQAGARLPSAALPEFRTRSEEAGVGEGDAPGGPGPDSAAASGVPSLERSVAAGSDTASLLGVASDRPFRFADLAVLGQYASTYLVCELDRDLVLLDQHAAHERVLFERLRAQAAAGEAPQQRLLVPDVVELDPAAARAATEYRPDLAALGFEIEPFGGDSWSVHAVPALLARDHAGRLVEDTLAEIAEHEQAFSSRDALDAVFARMACHAAIRAGDAVSPVEARALLEDLDRIPYAANCPHGRPVLIRLDRPTIETWFSRR